jgi:uncharacterized membrane protein (UPF0136 family)
MAAGAPLALIIIAGALVGGMRGQPIVGILVGVALGTVIAIAVWLGDRRRNRD